jgi:aminoglycoside phosphotransferase (APT) family kinase protein
LRKFHDATRSSALAGAKPVICHHDPGPNNTVFRDGMPMALIDFDFSAPGEALEDLAYMAWTWCVSSKPERGPAQLQALQVRVLVDAYALDVTARSGVVEAMLERQERNIRFWKDGLDGFGGLPTKREVIEERIRWSEREWKHTNGYRAEFASALR